MAKYIPHCVGCGDTREIFSIYGSLYKPSFHQALTRVHVCQKCLEAFITRRIDSRTLAIVDALALALWGPYKAISEASLNV